MPRYIDAEKAIEIAESNKAVLQSLGDIVDIREIVNDVPTADVQPVVHAKWEKPIKPYPYYSWKCSECGCEEYRQTDRNGQYLEMKYCPFCGAKMDKKEERYVRDIFITR